MRQGLLWVAAAMTVALASCSNDEPRGATGYGEFTPTFTADFAVQAASAENASAAPAVSQPSVSDFFVHLSRTDGTVDKTWSKVSEMSANEKFPVGKYQIEMYYGDINEEGFDKPYFYGSSDFTIYDGDVAKPEVVATLQNAMVSFDYTEAFKNYFTDYSTTIHSTGGSYITFTKDETRAAYVKPGDVSIAMTLTNREGKTVTLEPAGITDAKARTHYRVTFDVNGGEVGDAVLRITFDESVVDGGEVLVTLGDDIFNADVPAATPNNFTAGETLRYSEGDEPAEGPKVSLSAMAGFSEVVLTTQSEYLLSLGWPAEIDLTKVSPEQRAFLLKNGLKVSGLWGKMSNMAMVDFTGVVPNLRVYNGSSTHTFSLTVKDVLTRVSEPVSFTVSAPSVILAMPASTTTVLGTGEATCEVTYSGMDFEKNVSIQCLKSNGTWANSQIKNVTSLGDNKYKVTFTVPTSSSTVQAKAVYKNGVKSSDVMNVVPESPTITLSSEEADVWATKATLSLATSAGKAADMANIATVYVSKDNGATYSKASNVTVSGDKLTIAGLTAGTAYKVKASVVNSADKASAPIEFTTESATQLPNSDMESWNKKGIGSSHYDYLPYASGESDIWWATNNARGYDYSVFRVSVTSGCAVSYNSTVKHGGSHSAQIYTSGHGGGYASTSSIIYPAGAFAGSLYIGTYKWSKPNETVTTGHAFSSRPSSFSFWYEYMPKNSDQFKAEIEVRAGEEVIAKGEFIPEATSTSDTAFKQASINLAYTNKSKKATSIYVRFLSTTKTSFSESDFNKNTSTQIGDESIKVHRGSVLYIDDLSLNY